MDTGIYFELDRTALAEGIRIFRYKGSNPKSGDVYLTLSSEGVRFYFHSYKNGRHFSGCLFFLPCALDNDVKSSMSLTINTLLLTKADYEEDLSDVLNRGNNDLRYEINLSSNHRERTDIKLTASARLLLHFMFEMSHSSLFEESPNYDLISERFKSHFLFNSIWTKAEYEYNTRKLQQSPDQQPDELIFSVTAYAERRWVDIITDPRADRIFHESPWMDDTINEMNNVYSHRSLYDRTDGQKNFPFSKTLMDFSPEDGEISEIEREKGSKAQERRTAGIVRETAKMAMEWYMGKYRPDGVLRIRFGEKYGWVMWISFIIVCFIAIFGVAYCCVYPYLLVRMEACKLWSGSLVIVAVPIILMVMVYVGCGIKKRKRRSYFNMQTLPNVIMPRLLAAIFAGWMTIGLSDVVMGNHPAYYNYVFWSLALLMPTGLFLYFSVRKILPFSKRGPCVLISLFIMALSAIYSLLCGCVLLTIYSDENFLFPDMQFVRNPQILLVFSMLSMFVGVFIQMLFRNKSVSSTED